MTFVVVIPARYGSTRLPGKPLREIAGEPMISHVYRRAIESGAEEVIVATDDERIRAAAERFGAQVCMTAADHSSGTDRIAEVVDRKGYAQDQIVVNLQGDEPLIPAALIRQVAETLASSGTEAATLCERILTLAEVFDPNVVKVVTDCRGDAIYFSRAPIPWDRGAFAIKPTVLSPTVQYHRHIGMYAYRAGFISDYVSWPACMPEQAERLEQLRILWNGAKIRVVPACEAPGQGVDTEEDLARVERILAAPNRPA